MAEILEVPNLTNPSIAPQQQAHEVHHHDGDKWQSDFISTYIFSLDHKTIAKQYLITGMFMAVIGGLLSLIFRMQLGFPNADLGWLQPILGKWIVVNAETGIGKLDTDFYLATVTMHGTIMIFFVLTAGLTGTFANFLIPLQLGARDMASGFLNMLSFWLFFFACMVLGASFFLQTGPFGGGWTAYPPLSAIPQAASGSGAGFTLWGIALVFFIASTLLGGINYVATIINLRTKGMNMWRMPLTMWTILMTAILGILSFPVLLSAILLVLSDRSLGTGFFLSDIFIGGKALDQVGGTPVLYQHLFWFLGHPEVYIIILPSMGIVSEILAVGARKPIFGYKAMVFSVLAIGGLSFMVWAHHMFMSGVNPFLSNFFVILTLIIAVPSAVKVFNWIGTLYGGNIQFTTATIFGVGYVSLFISGGLTGIFLGNASIDIPMHDTYFVVAHFHIIMGVAAFFGMYAGIYHWFPKMFGRFMNETLGKIHVWGTLVSAYVVFWPMHYLGLAGVPRRYYSFDTFNAFNDFGDTNKIITVAAIVGFGFQVIFIVNFFYSMFKGKVCTSKNPWGATTLEWTTTELVPGHGNWEGDIPEVHRWAYDYNNPTQSFEGLDYIPQDVPQSIGYNEHGEMAKNQTSEKIVA